MPEAARDLATRLNGMLPRVRMTEVLRDVDSWTGFADRFTHFRTGNPATDKPALLAVVLADGTNLGLARMADASHGLSYYHLVNVAQWHISDDNYAAARARIGLGFPGYRPASRIIWYPLITVRVSIAVLYRFNSPQEISIAGLKGINDCTSGYHALKTTLSHWIFLRKGRTTMQRSICQ